MSAARDQKKIQSYTMGGQKKVAPIIILVLVYIM